MKKILLLSFLLVGLYSATAQNYFMSSPEGFGAAATGGGTPTSSNTVTVTTYAQLKAALTSTTAATAVILVSGTINCDYTSVLLNNKTIIGLPGARLINLGLTENIAAKTKPGRWDLSGILYIKPNSSNVIIRNLTFEGPGAYDVDGRDLITNEGTNIWVDHCEFQDGMDGNFDNKGTADNVTISWCKFTYLKPAIPGGFGGSDNHSYSDLIGSSKDNAPTDGNYSITFKNCYWAEGCKERMPRARNAELHILNCYYQTNVASSLAIGLGGGINNTTCYVENSDFANVNTIFKSYILKSNGQEEDGGTVDVKFDNCTKGATSIPVTNLDLGAATKPSYSYTTLPVGDVAKYVANSSCGAGATLQVTAGGILSAGCPNLGIENYALNGVRIYPSIVDTTLNIVFSEVTTEDATVAIYSTTGSKVLNVTSHDNVSVDVTALAKGLYLCTIKIGEKSTTLKFIKN